MRKASFKARRDQERLKINRILSLSSLVLAILEIFSIQIYPENDVG